MPSEAQKVDLARLREMEAKLEAEHALRAQCKFRTLFPDEGPLRRELYWWSLAFFASGKVDKERGIIAANQIGKTLTAGFEVTAHTTGQYPPWWPGKRFAGPQDWWLAGDTMLTTRDIQQVVMLGGIDGLDRRQFTGMIPPNLIYDLTRRSGGVSKCIDKVWIQHTERQHGAPCYSTIEFKSYDQGRKVFQGVPLKGGVWLDEEPPDPSEARTAEVSGSSDIYSECLTRLLTTEGLLMFTFTPLRGLTPFVKQYLETAEMLTREGTRIPAHKGFWPGAAEAMGAEGTAE